MLPDPNSERAASPDQPSASRSAPIPRADQTIAMALFLATALIYSPVLRFGFLNYDDTVYVTDNPHLRGDPGLGTLKWILFSFQPDNWFPVTRLSHLIDYTLFGLQAGYHHAVNVLIHALASVLLFAFLRRADVARWPAAFVASLFALHPLHVESVAWISERKDVLCAFFWFAALWAWAGWVKRPSRRRFALSLGLFALGLMSKPMIVTFPVLLLLLDLWPLCRLRPPDWKRLPELVREKLPFFILAAACACLTWLAQRSGNAIRSFETYGLGLRIENALVTPWVYIGKTLWPVRLSAIYSWPASFPFWQPVAAGISLAAVSFLVLGQVRRRPWLAVGWFWLLVTLVPVIGLVQVGEQVRADRYMYVPMVGPGLMLAGCAMELLSLRPRARWMASAAACACLAALAALSWSRIYDWRDSESLFGSAVAANPQNYSAWFYLGNTLLNVPGQRNQAISAFEQAVRANPGFAEARDRLARSLCEEGRSVECLLEFARTLHDRPDYALAHLDLGNALARLGRIPEAVPHFRQAVLLNPRSFPGQMNLGMALEQLAVQGPPEQRPAGIEEAVAHLRQAVMLDSSAPAARCELGNGLLQLPGHLAEAIGEFEAALSIDPDYAPAHRGLGNALLQERPLASDTVAKAILHLRAAERSAPDPVLQEQIDRLSQFGPGPPGR